MRIAIIEDEQRYVDHLRTYIERYHQENPCEYSIDVFMQPIDFIDHYRPQWDLLFMDIEMPMLDGISVGKKLREKDSETILIFVTKMAQYAINGYESGRWITFSSPSTTTISP